MNRFSAIVLVVLLAVIGYWFSDSARARTVSHIFDSLINGAPSINQTAFETGSLTAINKRRAELGLQALTIDEEIHDALARFAASHSRPSEMQLDPLFATLQSNFPSAQFLSATVLLDPRDETLTNNLADWEDACSPQYSTLSTLAFRDGYRKGCVAVLARRLPAFDLETANEEGGRFFQKCPHCESTHAIVLNRKSQTLILACPDCEKPYDVLAVDTAGRFRRTSEFFDGFRIPGNLVSDAGNDKKTMLAIWKAVLDHCDYAHDKADLDLGEAWKTSSQTWNDASGDCEDTSILLADALKSAGIDARVAVGWNIHIGQHAWCVAQIGDQQWVLESTLHLEEGESPTPRTVAEAGAEYQPEQLFNHAHLYLRNDGQTQAGCHDYWTGANWLSLPQL